MMAKPGAAFKATANDNVTVVDDSVIEVMTGEESMQLALVCSRPLPALLACRRNFFGHMFRRGGAQRTWPWPALCQGPHRTLRRVILARPREGLGRGRGWLAIRSDPSRESLHAFLLPTHRRDWLARRHLQRGSLRRRTRSACAHATYAAVSASRPYLLAAYALVLLFLSSSVELASFSFLFAFLRRHCPQVPAIRRNEPT